MNDMVAKALPTADPTVLSNFIHRATCVEDLLNPPCIQPPQLIPVTADVTIDNEARYANLETSQPIKPPQIKRQIQGRPNARSTHHGQLHRRSPEGQSPQVTLEPKSTNSWRKG